MTIRSFFAVPLKSATVRRLADHADTLCRFDSRAQVRWSDSGGYHLTLCFLGEINLQQVAALEQQARHDLQQPVFPLRLGRAAYHQVNPELAVLAAIANPNAELMQLQRRVAGMVAQAGIAVDETGFYPHVTLGRLPAGFAFDATEPWPELDLQMLADSVVLYQSKPGASGSIYTPLFEVPLNAGGSSQIEPARVGTA
jgi:2'-5' RNA ligase